MLNHSLNIKSLPNSIYKLTNNCEESETKLKALIADQLAKPNVMTKSSSGFENEKIKKIEIKICKEQAKPSNLAKN